MEIRAIEVAEAVRLLAEGEFTLEAALVIAEDILRRQAPAKSRPEPGLTPGPALTQRDCRPGSPGVAPLCGPVGGLPRVFRAIDVPNHDCLAFDRARVLGCHVLCLVLRRDFRRRFLAPLLARRLGGRRPPPRWAPGRARPRASPPPRPARPARTASTPRSRAGAAATTWMRSRRCSSHASRGMEIARGQHQQLAIAQRGHVGRDLLLAQQTEFAEELAAAQLDHGVVRQVHGHGARRHEAHFLAMAALGQHALVRQRQPRRAAC